MDFEQWKLRKELEEQTTSFFQTMKCSTASTCVFALSLTVLLLMVVGMAFAILK